VVLDLQAGRLIAARAIFLINCARIAGQFVFWYAARPFALRRRLWITEIGSTEKTSRNAAVVDLLRGSSLPKNKQRKLLVVRPNAKVIYSVSKAAQCTYEGFSNSIR